MSEDFGSSIAKTFYNRACDCYLLPGPFTHSLSGMKRLIKSKLVTINYQFLSWSVRLSNKTKGHVPVLLGDIACLFRRRGRQMDGKSNMREPISQREKERVAFKVAYECAGF